MALARLASPCDINVLASAWINGIVLNVIGTYGSAVVTSSEETSSQLNNQNIWRYRVIVHYDTYEKRKPGISQASFLETSERVAQINF